MDPNATFDALSDISRKLEQALHVVQNGGDGQNPSPPPMPAAGATKVAQEAPGLLQVLGKLAAAKNGDEVFSTLLESSLIATGAERGFIMLIEGGRRVRFHVGANCDQSFLQQNRPLMALINESLKTRKAAFKPLGIANESPTRSLMVIPLIFGERFGDPELGGLLYIERRGSTFDDAAFDKMQTLAKLGTLAIESFSLHQDAAAADEEVVHHKQNLEKLLEVSRRISSTLDVDELLELVVDKALEVTRASRGYIMLLEGVGDPEKGPVEKKLAFKVGRWWNGKDGEESKSRSLKESQFFFSKSITNQVLDTKEAICLTDALGGDGQAASVSIVQMELQSVMCAPLLDGAEVFGLVYVDSQAKNREFGQADLETFKGLAGQAAIALKNAILYAAAGEKERMEGELEIASRMQADLLPKTIPKVRGLLVAGHMEPAKEVGGDYYDFIEDDEDKRGQVLSIVVGDVSGKGLGAGIVAVMARCNLRTMIAAYGAESPNSILTYLNAVLSEELKPGQFMTMILMYWDSAKDVLRYSSAGHEHIIHWRASTGQAECFVSGGQPLGLVASAKCTEDQEMTIAFGDMVILYTDGVTEAMNEQDEEYSLEMLMEIINKHGSSSPQALIDIIKKEIEDFRGNAAQSDDISVVAIKRL